MDWHHDLTMEARDRMRPVLPGVAVLLMVSVIGCGRPSNDNAAAGAEGAIAQAEPGPPPATEMPVPRRATNDWPTFGHDAGRSGWSPVEFRKLPPLPTWTFTPGKPRWDYRKGVSVWSSPAVVSVDGQPRVFIGSYDHSLYCLDGLNGQKQWSFVAGDAVIAAPCVAARDAGPVVIFGSADRTVYALSARDGKKQWSFETFPWRDTVSPCLMSAPLVLRVAGRQLVFIGVANSDRSGLKNIQKGELLALDLETGEEVWRKLLTTTSVSAPGAGRVRGEDRLFVACRDGVVRALEPDDGQTLWEFTANELIRSSVAFAVVQGRPMVFFGTRHNSVYALDAADGKMIWKYKCGHWVDSTPAVSESRGKVRVIFGSYDRGVYALDAANGKEEWKVFTTEWVSASAAVAQVADAATAVISNLDGRLFAFDASTGRQRWGFDGGDFPWSHVQQGDAVWSSPAIGQVGKTKMLVFPCFSYRVFGFVEKD